MASPSEHKFWWHKKSVEKDLLRKMAPAKLPTAKRKKDHPTLGQNGTAGPEQVRSPSVVAPGVHEIDTGCFSSYIVA